MLTTSIVQVNYILVYAEWSNLEFQIGLLQSHMQLY